jgi:RHS repeat-associated protein
MHRDHLGSARLLTSMTKSIVQNLVYLPFGENNSTDSGISTHKFTGDERDSETSLDHTLFRQYSSQFARWTSPDPAGLAAVDPSNPQSWNRYAYVGNNPMNSIDPSGLCVHMLYDNASCFDGGFFGFGPSTTCIEDGVDVGCGSIFGSGGGGKGGTVAVSTWTPSGCVSIDGMSGNTCYPGFWSTVTINLPTGSDTGGGNSSWWGTFAKEFFKLSGGPGNVPTCAGQALTHMAGDLLPFTPSASSVIQATAPAAQAMAFNSAVAQTEAGIDSYIAARGLTVPLRSTVVRAMVAQGAESAVSAGVRANLAVQTFAVDAAALHSMYTTSGEARSGQCAAAFPIF